MKYLFSLNNLEAAEFLARPNRFRAEIRKNGTVTSAHIHDPGRLKELLVPGRKLLVAPGRGKLPWYIKAVRADDGWVLIDTALHSRIARMVFRYLPELRDIKEIKSEVNIGSSRIDFTLDGTPLEVKGVTLMKGNIALFPDAPTARGRRHVEEIIKTRGKLLFLIFRNAEFFGPNAETDPDFTESLRRAYNEGIDIIGVGIFFDGKSVYYRGTIKFEPYPERFRVNP